MLDSEILKTVGKNTKTRWYGFCAFLLIFIHHDSKCWRRSRSKHYLHYNNRAVECVSKFTYLGFDVDSDGHCDSEIHRRLGIPGSIMGQLDNVWHQQKVSLSTELRIYVSLVLSVVLYGSETWTMRNIQDNHRVRRVQSFHKHSAPSLFINLKNINTYCTIS